MAPALILALLLATADTPPAAAGEPLPPGAPTDEYMLAGWCYGALAEYLEIYGQVKPDLVDIDRMFGTPVKETEPYAEDIAAARDELKIFAGAIQAAEKASPQPIAPQGALAIRGGQAIWRSAETKSRRELARAWLSWGLPDRCDTNARGLQAKASVLGQALSYNAAPTQTGPAAAPSDGALTLAPIAPVVTHMNPPPPPPIQAAMVTTSQAPPPQPAAPTSGDSGVIAQPAPAERVIQEPLPAANTVSAAAAPPRPSPPAVTPVAAAPQPPPSDQSAEPVL
jgi:hypothetical protein